MTKLHPAVPDWLIEAPDSAQRKFLLLQGPIGHFFERLAQRLSRRGHDVHRVLFNGGDQFFSARNGSRSRFGGSLFDWPAELEALLDHQGTTDIVLFGDCRPLHRLAIRVAAQRGIPVHVFEEGYLRPNWLTLELGGVNRHSPLSRNPDWYLEKASRLPAWDEGRAVRSSFRRRAFEDVLYRLSSLLNHRHFAGYRTHKPWDPLDEYRSGAKRFFFIPWAKRHNRRVSRSLIDSGQKFFVFPLQLEADAQIRFHSPLRSMVPAITAIIDSFARHAPSDHQLILTEHPLDTGVVDLKKVAVEAAQRAGLSERLRFIHCGSPEPLVAASAGVVTVNSTIGIIALRLGVPVKTLGYAVYDIPRLTFQGPLDEFWHGRSAPDAQTFDCFRRVVAASSQINGGLYSADAIEMAVESAAARLSTSLGRRLSDWGLTPREIPQRADALAQSPILE